MSNRSFGVELEIVAPVVNGFPVNREHAARVLRDAGLQAFDASYTHTVTPQWKVVSDGSVVGGFEVVSPVLSGEAGRAELVTAVRALVAAGYSVNSSCGMHVHVDARDLDMLGLKRVMKQWLIEEHNFDLLVHPSRLTNYYCRSNMSAFGPRDSRATWEAAHKKMGVSARSITRCFPGRYWKLNVDALWRHHTVEVRMHEGCLDEAKVVRWVLLVTTFVDGALRTNNVHVKNAVELRCNKPEHMTVDQWADSMLARFKRMAARVSRREVGGNALVRQPRREARCRDTRMPASQCTCARHVRGLRCRETGVDIRQCTCQRHVEMRQDQANGTGLGITPSYR